MGEAAVEILLDLGSIRPGGRITFQLANRGQVEVMAGKQFHVERWDGQAWSPVPSPGAGGLSQAFSDVGQLLGPGEHTGPQVWPAVDSTIQTGWYRIVKPARVEGIRLDQPDLELIARARFHVGG